MDDKVLDIKICSNGAAIFIECDEINVFSVGDTLEEAFDEFAIHLKHLCQYYVSIPDKKLNEYALEQKDKFKEVGNKLLKSVC
jgi:predicted RNase H-like HicB family nuclease